MATEAADEARIDACDDTATLDGWIVRAANATGRAQVFDGLPDAAYRAPVEGRYSASTTQRKPHLRRAVARRTRRRALIAL